MNDFPRWAWHERIQSAVEYIETIASEETPPPILWMYDNDRYARGCAFMRDPLPDAYEIALLCDTIALWPHFNAYSLQVFAAVVTVPRKAGPLPMEDVLLHGTPTLLSFDIEDADEPAVAVTSVTFRRDDDGEFRASSGPVEITKVARPGGGDPVGDSMLWALRHPVPESLWASEWSAAAATGVNVLLNGMWVPST